MKKNNSRRTCAARWIQAVLLAPLLVCSVSLYAADEKKPAPKAAPAKAAAPAAKGPGAAGAPAAHAAPGAAGAARPGGGPAAARTGAPGAETRGAETRGGAGVRGGETRGAETRGGAGVRGAETRGAETRGGAGVRSGETRGAEVRGGPGGRVTPGSRPVGLRGGGEAHVDARGRVTDLHRGGMDVHRGTGGVRNVRMEREDHSRVFVGRGGHGYVQGRYMYGGHEFGHRTYYEHGRAYDRFYRRYDYHGVYLEGYAPVRYYPAAYYGWAYAPWATPAPYAWGWVGNPWAAYYGAYFTPYPVYASPAFWLTDFMISASLAADYQARLDAANGAPPQAFAAPPTPLTPDVKQAISAEVQRQIALENAESQQVARNAELDPQSSGIVRMLTDNTSHVFVAGTDVDVIDARGTQCALSQGDVIQLNPAPLPPTATEASLIVLASKPQECLRGGSVSVQLTDLQDMQNHMRETIDQGLGEMQTAKGLPPVPQSAKAMPIAAPFAALAPPPDPSAATQITQQAQEADNAEKDVTADVAQPAGAAVAAIAAPPPPPAEPKEPKPGQTIAEIESNLGRPTVKFSVGSKTTYSYKDLGIKIVFTDGKVTSIN
jgi:hypothetical protein